MYCLKWMHYIEFFLVFTFSSPQRDYYILLYYYSYYYYYIHFYYSSTSLHNNLSISLSTSTSIHNNIFLFNYLLPHLEIVYSIKCPGKENEMLHYFSSYAISSLVYLQYLIWTITIHHSFLSYYSEEFQFIDGIVSILLFAVVVCLHIEERPEWLHSDVVLYRV